MKAMWLFRIVAVLFFIFAVGHTIGFLTFKPPTKEGLAVREAMMNVHFEVQGNGRATGIRRTVRHSGTPSAPGRNSSSPWT